MNGRLVANWIFTPRLHLERKKLLNLLKNCPYISFISLLLFPPSHVWWFSGWHDSHPPLLPRSNGSSIANSGQSRHPLFCGPHIIEPGHENTPRKNGIKLEFFEDVNWQCQVQSTITNMWWQMPQIPKGDGKMWRGKKHELVIFLRVILMKIFWWQTETSKTWIHLLL